jgi:Ser/Thr protein kinase RdoA (MazF antagonist)
LPEWLSREQHHELAGYWEALDSDVELRERLASKCRSPEAARDATEWLATHAARMAAAEAPLVEADRFCLLHFDTRSDNIRVDGELLRIFDWPFASVGPPEFDFAAFAQSIALEGGPDPETLTRWYSEVLPLDAAVLTASAAGISGYFANRGSSPDLPGLPRLRSFQRRQLKSSLAWAARRLELRPPLWLEHVAD